MDYILFVTSCKVKQFIRLVFRVELGRYFDQNSRGISQFSLFL